MSAVLPEEEFKIFDERRWREYLGLPETFTMPTEFIKFLLAGDTDFLSMQDHISGMQISIRWTTARALARVISPIGYNHAISLRRSSARPYRASRARKATSICGKELCVPVTTRAYPEEGYRVRVLHGVVRDTPDSVGPVPPNIYDEFLSSNVLVDQSGTTAKATLEQTLWRCVTKGILHFNNLYNNDGSPKDEAYDPELILRLFIRREFFNERARELFTRKYFAQLDAIKDRRSKRID